MRLLAAIAEPEVARKILGPRRHNACCSDHLVTMNLL
jgi:hypothetical protein